MKKGSCNLSRNYNPLPLHSDILSIAYANLTLVNRFRTDVGMLPQFQPLEAPSADKPRVCITLVSLLYRKCIAFVSEMCRFCVGKRESPSCLPENQANTPKIPALSPFRSPPASSARTPCPPPNFPTHPKSCAKHYGNTRKPNPGLTGHDRIPFQGSHLMTFSTECWRNLKSKSHNATRSLFCQGQRGR